MFGSLENLRGELKYFERCCIIANQSLSECELEGKRRMVDEYVFMEIFILGVRFVQVLIQIFRRFNGEEKLDNCYTRR